jgi:hypothetical protein
MSRPYNGEKEVAVRDGRKVGGVVGAILFIAFGIIPGLHFGTLIGVKTTGAFLGTTSSPSVLMPVIISMGMLTGVLVAGLIFLVTGVSLGWLIGKIAAAIRVRKSEPIRNTYSL